MGDVLKFGKRPEKKEVSKTKLTAGDARNLMEVFGEFLEQFGVVEGGLDVDIDVYLLQIQTYVNSLQGHYTNESIALRRERLKDMETSDLHDMARVGTKMEWKRHPSLYLALIDEIKFRRSQPETK